MRGPFIRPVAALSAPAPHRGKTNEPGYVRLVAEYAAAEVFRVPLSELAEVTTANARKLFGI
jgi:TatD DNase family protein